MYHNPLELQATHKARECPPYRADVEAERVPRKTLALVHANQDSLILLRAHQWLDVLADPRPQLQPSIEAQLNDCAVTACAHLQGRVKGPGWRLESQ
jgi:hypothetical protein